MIKDKSSDPDRLVPLRFHIHIYGYLVHGVQRRMISVVNLFVFFRLLLFALLLLYVT